MKNRFLLMAILVIFLCGVAGLLFARSLSVSQESKSLTLIDQEKVNVIATFYPLAEFAQRVGGELVIVTNLTPAGVEPHDFEPTPQDRIQLEKSAVVIYNGAGLERWLENIKNDLPHVQFAKTTEGITLLHGEEHDEHKEDAGQHEDTEMSDPHVWLDPVLVQQQVDHITRALIHADPTHQTIYLDNTAKLKSELQALDKEFQEGLAACQSREIVTSHNAFQYLAKRYDLTVFPLAGLSPDEEPSAKKMADVADFVKKRGVKYIFFESLVSPKLAETIALETGAQTLAFQPLEGLTQEDLNQGKNYLSVQRENLAALRTALRCQ